MANLVDRHMEWETKQRNRLVVALLSILLVVLGTYLLNQWQKNGTLMPVWNETALADESPCGTYYTLYAAESDEIIEQMSRTVHKGDELLTADNRHYRVISIEGYNAYCELLGERSTEQVLEQLYSNTTPVSTGASSVQYTETNSIPVWNKNFQSVAIYCTHTDESYVPTSGTESKHGGGDILEVAETMVNELETQGIPVIHSDNLHDPHDVNAYQRSRKTAAELLKGAPAAIIDVHRDGIPDPKYYATEIDGKPATQIRIVVGRQNQNSEANIAFAEKMKAYYDDVKPGLIKSIFLAKGNYNQDLAGNSVLLEVGTHTNTLEAAQNSAKEFAEVLPQFLGLTGDIDKNTASDRQSENHTSEDVDKETGGIGKSILVLVVMVLAGSSIWMFINKNGGKV